MSSDIDLVFTCKSAVINANRIDTEITLTIGANEFNPPTLRKFKRVARSYNQRRKFTTVYGSTKVGRISVPYISSTARPYWQEFFESVSEEEVFTIDATGLPGVDRLFEATITDSDFDTPRIDILDAYTASFNFEEEL